MWLNINRNVLRLAFQEMVVSLLAFGAGFYLSRAVHGQASQTGALWAMISGILVHEASRRETVAKAWPRVLGSLTGAVISAIYLSFLPLSLVSLFVCVGLTVLVCYSLEVPNYADLAVITVAVIMVVSFDRPGLNPLVNAAMRFLDACIGTGVAVLVMVLWPEPRKEVRAWQPDMGMAMGKFKDRLKKFIWDLNISTRAVFCGLLGLTIHAICRWLGWGWQISFLFGWNIALATYLVLQYVVIFSADAARTRERVSKIDPTRWRLLSMLILVTLGGVISVGIMLTAVGQHPAFHFKILVFSSGIAVILSWLLLHTTFGIHYATLYFDDTDWQGRPFPDGLRRGFEFPGAAEPTYADFLYVAFAIGLTYAMSDVNVTNRIQRQTVLVHSVVSFFFYSIVLAVVLNAVITS